MGNKPSLTEVLRAQVVILDGERYTERDTRAKLNYFQDSRVQRHCQIQY